MMVGDQDEVPSADVLPDDIRKKRTSGQQKREALEREVSLLQKMLREEEMVNQILELVKNKNDGSAISIPHFLPPKVKELLAELVLVESEISRLESQIRQLKLGLKQEEEITNETRPRQWHLTTPIHHLQGKFSSSTNSNTHTPLHKFAPEKVAFDTKALHFISKAIKGDYQLNDVTINEKTGSLRLVTGNSDKIDNSIQEDAKFQSKVTKKTGILASASPLRDRRNSSPKPKERVNMVEKPADTLSKSLSNTVALEENIQQWQPNKLSEHIMKCLNFIYIRLLRTSRQAELEKSGPVSRTSQFTSMISRSFRADTSLNTSISLQKDSRQQDPYGIFNVEGSITRDVGPYKNLVIFTSSSMDPKFISSPSSVPLLRKLRVLMNHLQTVDLRSLTRQQKLAFWINMYNACIMHGFLQYGVPYSPEKLLSLTKKASFNVGGKTVSAHAIEHNILRKPTSPNNVNHKSEKEDKEVIIHKLFGLDSVDPNVTFALSCGTRSSPAVRLYTAENIAAELEKSKLEYLQASVVVTSSKKIAIPQLLHRNMLDFAMDAGTLVEWICHQLPTSGSLRKSIVDCFRGHNNSGKLPSNVNFEELPCDFEFQYLLAI